MIPQLQKLFGVLAGLMFAGSASAHPGHGPHEVPPAHWFSSPDHLGLLLLGAVGIFCTARMLTWRKSAKGAA
jgi:hypothetical protein